MKTTLFLLFLLPFFIFSQEASGNDRDAEFPGGIDAMKEYLINNIEYPEISKEIGDFGKVYLEFVVNKDGSIEQIEILRGVSPEIDQEAIRVVREMPNWVPCIYKGEIVRVRCKVPINFELVDDTENHIYKNPQESASYPRGNKALEKFINKKKKYPEVAKMKGDEGEVVVEFVVNRNGTLEQFKILKSVSKELDEEAIRLISSMPKWKPAKQSKKSARSRVNLTIEFKLKD